MLTRLAFGLAAFAPASILAQQQPTTPATRQHCPPPLAAVRETASTNMARAHRSYYWLRDRDNPEVIKYLQDENAYTKAVHGAPPKRCRIVCLRS